MKHGSLHAAKRVKNDEYYTLYEDVADEVERYAAQFRGKSVYCNCDDPRVSAFAAYFTEHYERLGLCGVVVSGFSVDGRRSEVYTYDGQTAVWRELDGDGDFRCDESLRLLACADIVVTNPPFSLFREYVALLESYGKEYLLVGSLNALTYRDIFAMVYSGRLRLGHHYGSWVFAIPPDAAVSPRVFERDGRLYQKFGNIAWFTNLDVCRRLHPLVLTERYDARLYPHYDNYEAIDVSRVQDIPCDYGGVMGVPITFLTKHDPSQFEVLGIANGRFDYSPLAHPVKRYEQPVQHHTDGSLSNGSKVNTRAMLRLDAVPDKTYYTAANAPGYLIGVYARVLIRMC